MVATRGEQVSGGDARPRLREARENDARSKHMTTDLVNIAVMCTNYLVGNLVDM